MKTTFATAILAGAEAYSLNPDQNTIWATWPRAPQSPLIHNFYCTLRGPDPRYGPCPNGDDRLSSAPYPPGYFDKYLNPEPTPAPQPEPAPEPEEAPSQEEEEEAPEQIHLDHKGDKDYLHKNKYYELYPFMAVSFFDPETHEGKHTVTEPSWEHTYAKPEECEPCKALQDIIEA